jgi:hypothetical protein
VAAFTIASYPSLQPDSSDITNTLLLHIARQTSSVPIDLPDTVIAAISGSFNPPAAALRVNILWFISLVLSITCALAATLIQQWVRVYMHAACHSSVPYRRGHIRAFVFEGLQRFHVSATLEAVPALLHASVFLFFAGLVQFLLPINATLAYTLMGLILMVASCYVALTILPILYMDCPFQTPFTKSVWRLAQILQILRLYIQRCISHGWERFVISSRQRWSSAAMHRATLDDYLGRLYGGMEKWQEMSASSDYDMTVAIDCRALQRALGLLDHEEGAEPFVEGIPGFLHSYEARDPTAVVVYLLDKKLLGSRITMLLHSCVAARALPVEEARRRRALTCLRAVWSLTERLGPLWLNRWFSIQSELRAYTYLRDDRDPAVAVNALCTTALAAHGFLSALADDTLAPIFPDSAPILEDIVDIVTTLVGPSPSLKEECTSREDLTTNGPVVNLITFVLRLLPLLQTEMLPPADRARSWDTLRILSTIDTAHASLSAQVALLRLCTEDMSDLWDDDVTLDDDTFASVPSGDDMFAGMSGSDDVSKLAYVLMPVCATLSQQVHDELAVERLSRASSPAFVLRRETTDSDLSWQTEVTYLDRVLSEKLDVLEDDDNDEVF